MCVFLFVVVFVLFYQCVVRQKRPVNQGCGKINGISKFEELLTHTSSTCISLKICFHVLTGLGQWMERRPRTKGSWV